MIDAASPSDATPDVCALHQVTCLPREGGPLYGHAVRTGIAASQGRRVILMDADGSHAPAFVEKLWAERDNADIVIASRYVPGGQTENPWILIFLSLIVNVVFRVVLGLRCADVSNSFRLYPGERLRKLKLDCDNFDIVEEILVKLTHGSTSCTIRELPFTFEKRKEGKTKRQLFLFAVGYLFTLCRLVRMKWNSRREQQG